MRASKSIIPSELARKVSPWIVNGAEMAGTVGKTTFTGLAAILLCVNPEHNGFVYAVGPWICPGVAVGLMWSLRRRLWQGSFVNPRPLDANDPVARRLVELYKSNEARRHLWREALRLSGILSAIVWTIAFLQRNSLTWAIPSLQILLDKRPGHCFWCGFAFGTIFSFVVLGSDYQRWCLMTWTKRESSLHADTRLASGPA